MQCNSSQDQKEVSSAIENKIRDTLSTIPGCQTCQLKEVTVPECEKSTNKRRKRATDEAMKVLFSLVVSKAANSTEDGVEEKSEAVLFQMQYAVATGQFMITLRGINMTADRSSFRFRFSSVTCDAGLVMSSDGKGCGKWYYD